MYITQQYYRRLIPRVDQQPSPHFRQLYKDLYRVENKSAPTADSFNQAGQYNFSELGSALLDMCASDLLKQLDLFVIAYWSHEFDPKYSFSAYLQHKYNISAHTYDICDMGILSPIMALKLILCSDVNNALLLCMDQTTVISDKDFSGVKPTHCSARAIFFDRCKINALAEIKAVSIDDHPISDVNQIITAKDSAYNCAEIFNSIFKINKQQTYKFSVADSEYPRCGNVHLNSA